MTPTQAQIDAAKRAIMIVVTRQEGCGTYEELAQAALTAAAEVGFVDTAIANGPLVQKELKRLEATTIERCAERLDGMAQTSSNGFEIDILRHAAAAIRALATEGK